MFLFYAFLHKIVFPNSFFNRFGCVWGSCPQNAMIARTTHSTQDSGTCSGPISANALIDASSGTVWFMVLLNCLVHGNLALFGPWSSQHRPRRQHTLKTTTPVQFNEKTSFHMKALSVPVPPRSNTPWGTHFSCKIAVSSAQREHKKI